MSAEPMAAVEFRGLVKDFAVGLRGVKVRAVDQLSLSIAPGEVFGLLGPNGSGKSTSIKILLGLIRPTAGGCTVFGVPSSRVEARLDVGYLPESPYFYRHLSGRELVRFYARLSVPKGAALDARVDEVIGWVGMSGAADRRVGTYSKGMLQRIGLAQALVHDPRLVVLDEPTAGVDPAGAADIAALILKLKAQGKTVLITSHLLAQIEEICDRVAILDRGRLILTGTVDEVAGLGRRQSLLVDGLPAAELEELRAWLAARGHALESVQAARGRLDQVFLARTGRREAAAPDGRAP
jgi:ABC-2 type transport system ATP-binding protein